MPEPQLYRNNKSTNGRSFKWYLAPLRGAFRVLGALAPKTTARLALVLFRLPFRHSTPAREAGWLESADRFELEIDGERIVGWSWGEGPVVLLAHGWEGRGSQMGAFARPLVEAGFRVVTFDGPGHGQSGGRLSSLPQFASVVRQLAEPLGAIHGVVGHYFGCAASSFAARDGFRAARFVWVSPPADLGDYTRFFADLVGLSDKVVRLMIDRMESAFHISWDEARTATLTPVDGTDLLILHDHKDTDSPFANAEAIRAAWTGSRLVATEGLGHRRILRNREVVAQSVAFMTEGIAMREGGNELPVAEFAEGVQATLALQGTAVVAQAACTPNSFPHSARRASIGKSRDALQAG